MTLTLYRIYHQVLKTLDGSSRTSLKLCVSVRKKLQTYYWKNDRFKEFKPELSLPDVPKVVSWCKESICVGFKRDYYLVEVRVESAAVLGDIDFWKLVQYF